MLLTSLLGRCRASGSMRPMAFAFGARAFGPGAAAPHVTPAASAASTEASPWGQRRRSSSRSRSSSRLYSAAEEQTAAAAVVGGEEAPPAPSSAPTLKLKKRQRRTVTGGLKNLPIALPAVELLNRALRTVKYMKVRTGQLCLAWSSSLHDRSTFNLK